VTRRALRVLIADDEPLAREGMRRALELVADPRTTVVAECDDGAELVRILKQERVDVLLLDIQMPVVDGFAVLEQLEPEQMPPAVIFVTAFDEYAIRAFEVHALDYLLKPVPADRLVAALHRAARRVHEWEILDGQHLAVTEPAADPVPAGPLTQLLVRDRERTVVVPVDTIEWIGADAYYVHLHTARARYMLRERMSVLEDRLDPAHFLRTHRSAIVRIDCVREIRAVSRYEHEILLASGQRAPLSRDRRSRLEAILSRRVAKQP
jgi:two-component system LytT family response regulator